MQFNSYSYLLLLIPAVGLFWSLPVRLRRGYVLLLSILYYATWSAGFVLVPLFLCVGVYLIARRITQSGTGSGRWFWIGIAYVLAIFTFFRYWHFLVDNIGGVLRMSGRSPLESGLQIAVPLGISFYSFEAISYLIDARQGRIKDARFSDLYLFIMFWPHLMAGPIVRFRELLPQLAFSKPFELSMLQRGLSRLVLGLVQKNLIANSLGGWVDEGFFPKAAPNYTTIDSWTLAVAFGLQIYFDFAAYSNMAIGVAQLIGVTLPENFRFPYHAATPADFWNRWHMTLSRWIRDYLFFPVNARFLGAPGPLYASLLGIMALVGLWHGAGWGFVAWGVLHGLYLVVFRIWESFKEKRAGGWAGSRMVALGWRVFTLVAVTAAWVPFRASTGAQGLHILTSMFVRPRFGVSYSTNFYLVTLLVAAYCFAEPYWASAVTRAESWVAERRVAIVTTTYGVWPLVYAFGLLLFIIFDDRDTQFIYFQF